MMSRPLAVFWVVSTIGGGLYIAGVLICAALF